MKLPKKGFAFVVLIFIAFHSDAQSPVMADWRQTIKISLNSINKSNSIALDHQGNCYVLGTTWIPDSAKDILLIKFNQQGEEEWQRIYDNPSHGDDIPTCMTLDPEGNIWICGIAKTKTNNADFLIVKFTPEGVPVSDELYDGKDHLFDCATTIIAEKKGSIYVAGYETSIDSGINMMLLKCRPDGSISWRRTFASRQMDVANELFVDDSSNVYVCGTANNGQHSADILVQKYDEEGKKKWQLIYDGVLSQSDAGQYISADDSMNIYVTGFMNHVNGRADIPLLKINRNGVLTQENYHNGQIADCGSVDLLALNDMIYLTGGCDDYNIGVKTTFLSQYDKTGREKYYVPAPEDVQFMNSSKADGLNFIFGAKTTHPESTLIPFIAEFDSTEILWTFADSTVFGLAHITFAIVDHNDVYFLGDDTGDATGTISIFKYILSPETEKKKIRGPKKIK